MHPRIAIIEAKRTPIGKFLGGFRHMTAVDLGTAITSAVIDRAGIQAEEVDAFIFGNGRQAGGGPNPARQISHRAGVPDTTPAYTVNMACASSLKSIALGAEAIGLGRASCVVAGGTESMTNVPFMLPRARLGYRLGNDKMVDGMYKDGFDCPLSGMVMGETAEVLAEEFGITREEQDTYAMNTQHRAEAAAAVGFFAQEIVPVTARDDRGRDMLIEADEHPRAGVTMESLQKLPAVFKRDGTVTPGNASGITDGAAAVVLMSEEQATARGLEPLACIVDYTEVGVEPERMGIGPVPATRQILERNKITLDDIDRIELNEAFAAQVLACQRELKFDMDKVNVRGGAISLGHPIGATGARIVVTLLNEMKQSGARRGLATLCVSGGLGMALLVERG